VISIITCTNREQFMENVFKNYSQQSWQSKELIIILNKDTMNLDKWLQKAKNYQNVSVFQLHERATLGDCLNFAIMKAQGSIIAKFDDDDYYGPNYLAGAMKAFNNKEVMVAGKSSYYIYFNNKKALIFVGDKENAFVETVAGATLLFRKEIFHYIRFEKVNRAEDYFFVDECKKKGIPIYSLDRNDFAVIRHNTENHTWKISDEDLMGWGELIATTEDFHSYVTKK
jgi:cellulose synthase/poly-beta-1,6-N-acetylglucosamine synthase-like glycosyltransferase